ncbi:MAG: carboxymuconolactone decarboxylase family protein [Planctomycetota bacterium]|jgi:AhpD family alkylhydroperoxidase
MLPRKLKLELFDRLSVKTMRHVSSIPRGEATGLVKHVYDMIAEDFFINGSLTSHSRVPELLAGVWTGGRESILVDDHLDRTTKEAMTAVVSQLNECAYCGDMLVSLVHAGRKHTAAKNIFAEREDGIAEESLREKLVWMKQVLSGPDAPVPPLPFAREALPEVIGSILAISHINRFSHIVMDGSPVSPLFGSRAIKGLNLRMFGHELKSTKTRPIDPDRTAALLPGAPLPADMTWARPNPRIARAMARWAAAIKRETAQAVSPGIRDFVTTNLDAWDGSPMPLSRSWVEEETVALPDRDREMARFALIVAKSAPQIDDATVRRVHRDEEQFVRTLAWASFSGARRVAANVARKAGAVSHGGEHDGARHPGAASGRRIRAST